MIKKKNQFGLALYAIKETTLNLFKNSKSNVEEVRYHTSGLITDMSTSDILNQFEN